MSKKFPKAKSLTQQQREFMSTLPIEEFNTYEEDGKKKGAKGKKKAEGVMTRNLLVNQPPQETFQSKSNEHSPSLADTFYDTATSDQNGVNLDMSPASPSKNQKKKNRSNKKKKNGLKTDAMNSQSPSFDEEQDIPEDPKETRHKEIDMILREEIPSSSSSVMSTGETSVVEQSYDLISPGSPIPNYKSNDHDLKDGLKSIENNISGNEQLNVAPKDIKTLDVKIPIVKSSFSQSKQPVLAQKIGDLKNKTSITDKTGSLLPAAKQQDAKVALSECQDGLKVTSDQSAPKRSATKQQTYAFTKLTIATAETPSDSTSSLQKNRPITNLASSSPTLRKQKVKMSNSFDGYKSNNVKPVALATKTEQQLPELMKADNNKEEKSADHIPKKETVKKKNSNEVIPPIEMASNESGNDVDTVTAEGDWTPVARKEKRRSELRQYQNRQINSNGWRSAASQSHYRRQNRSVNQVVNNFSLDPLEFPTLGQASANVSPRSTNTPAEVLTPPKSEADDESVAPIKKTIQLDISIKNSNEKSNDNGINAEVNAEEEPERRMTTLNQNYEVKTEPSLEETRKFDELKQLIWETRRMYIVNSTNLVLQYPQKEIVLLTISNIFEPLLALLYNNPNTTVFHVEQVLGLTVHGFRILNFMATYANCSQESHHMCKKLEEFNRFLECNGTNGLRAWLPLTVFFGNRNCLHLAAVEGDLCVLHKLLQYAHYNMINFEDHDGKTPLYYARHSFSKSMALLAAGAVSKHLNPQFKCFWEDSFQKTIRKSLAQFSDYVDPQDGIIQFQCYKTENEMVDLKFFLRGPRKYALHIMVVKVSTLIDTIKLDPTQVQFQTDYGIYRRLIVKNINGSVLPATIIRRDCMSLALFDFPFPEGGHEISVIVEMLPLPETTAVFSFVPIN